MRRDESSRTRASRFVAQAVNTSGYFAGLLRADARTRTGDPFITRERRVRDGWAREGTPGHVPAAQRAVPRLGRWTGVPACAQADVPVLYPARSSVFRSPALCGSLACALRGWVNAGRRLDGDLERVVARGKRRGRETCRLTACGGLENRYPSLGGSRVRIPSPPPTPGSRFFKRVSGPLSVMATHVLLSMLSTLSLRAVG
jgi:hypothetical protein